MPIIVCKNQLVFKLSTDNWDYCFRCNDYGLLEHVCSSAAVPDTAETLLQTLAPDKMMPFTAYPKERDMLSNGSPGVLLQEYGTFNAGDFRIPALKVRSSDGTSTVRLRWHSCQCYAGTPVLENLPCARSVENDDCETLEIKLTDPEIGLAVYLSYTVFPHCDIIVRGARIVNESSSLLTVERAMSMQLDLAPGNYDMIQLPGAWGRERHAERHALHHGIQSINSNRGLSSHAANPALVLAERTATETQGCVYGVMLAYSGNFLGEVEVSEMDSVRIVMGINPELFSWPLTPGSSFTTPQAIIARSEQGLGGMSRQLHRFFRRHWLPEKWATAKRPLLINNWEATYFDINEEKLLNIARSAAQVGVEMLVLDDGWFGKRNNDLSSLGDWYVNENKIPNLEALVRRVNELGMKFGLWFEPEMVSEDSDLYRSHPDWVLRIPNRSYSLSRHQLVLDMGRDEVVENIFQQMKNILSRANIEYIKWDANRIITECCSGALPPERQGEAAHRFVLGVYKLHARLLQEFPDLLIEGCSGGGGRFDAGILYYAPQIWCSDLSDAADRVRIQLGTSLFYPCACMGAHVSSCPNLQNLRITPLATRGNIAMSGTFGYEMDLKELSDGERQQIAGQIAMFHRLNPLVQNGDLYRLSNICSNNHIDSWCIVSPDRQKGFLTVFRKNTDLNQPPVRIRLQGLEPDAVYQIDNRTLSGKALMNIGLTFELEQGDAVSRIIEFAVV